MEKGNEDSSAKSDNSENKMATIRESKRKDNDVDNTINDDDDHYNAQNKSAILSPALNLEQKDHSVNAEFPLEIRPMLAQL